ncbi:MAG: CaiB/BaiF CoA-transferase family protein [Gammaproteobacteria bacterium]|nr:CaiB/BaiF CoA-transferase family protein [Gammaproteobacteria bacterium]MCY4281876.1 CaiB/BaiF CoA-transferase family protein [Gammaproteobacteria bacterium]MCY4337650.1 CaiB/BaiF CoA-transferase family protein [Gammaproteobacteria bacterium]
MTNQELPLAGIKVVEFSHMVMGPSAGLLLADLGADVIKVEPLTGDNTRRLRGSGAGYFSMYNRNKRSVCIDLKSARGRDLARRLLSKADVFIENFRPGAMDAAGFSYDELAEDNPGLLYYSARGFLAGPYEHRTALDEVAQMMGGLAYMTGPPGQPLRAGASVIDVVGGMFGAIGLLSALELRRRSGRGQHINSALFESTAFLVGQHMAQYAVTGTPAPPMPVRVSAWAVYDIFTCKDDQQVFVAVVSDTQWRKFCAEFALHEFARDDTLAENNSRVQQRDLILPRVRALFLELNSAELMAQLDRCGLPYAPVSRPEDLFADPHLLASDGLLDVTTPEGKATRLPALPVQLDGKRPGLRRDVPKQGEHTREVMQELGLVDAAIDALINDRVLA